LVFFSLRSSSDFLHFTLERRTLLLFFFFQRIIVYRKLSIIARVVPFLLPFSFLEQTRFRFLEQTTKKREKRSICFEYIKAKEKKKKKRR